MANRIKHIIFILIMLMLVAPGIQAYFHLVPEKELHGDFAYLKKPEFSKSSILDGSYQAKFDPWMEENIGFHNTLIRLRNQYDYSLFHLPHADGVIRGKGGQLYEYDYIRAWMGEDFVGEALLDKKLRQFRFLQQKLKEQYNIDLVLVFEPGKASVYPEDIPEKYIKAQPGKSNYDFISARALELGINLIDLNSYFIQIKDTISYPLYPPQGTHWSEFAMWYAADSLLNYIEETRGIKLRDIIMDSVEYSGQLRSTDYDVGTSLNLFFELEHGKMPYPQYHFSDDSAHQKPNVLVIADSYYWNIFNTRIPKHIFNNEAFWYFYKKVYPDTYFNNKTVDQLNLKTEIEKQDVIFMMATERFLYKFDRGFVDDAFNIYGPHSDLDLLTRYQTSIVNLDTWFAEIILEAKDEGISLGEMMEKEANFLLWKQKPETYYSIYGPPAMIKNITSDSSWYADVKRRAAASKVSIEDRLMEEAAYMLKNQYPEAYRKYERIMQITKNIRADSTWHAYIIQKAAANFMTEKEMIRADAEYIYWKENQ